MFVFPENVLSVVALPNKAAIGCGMTHPGRAGAELQFPPHINVHNRSAPVRRQLPPVNSSLLCLRCGFWPFRMLGECSPIARTFQLNMPGKQNASLGSENGCRCWQSWITVNAESSTADGQDTARGLATLIAGDLLLSRVFGSER